MKGKLIVAGSVNFDASIYVNQIPKLGETILGNKLIYSLGGKGANQAIASTKLAKETIFYCTLGDDSNYQYILSKLKEYNVNFNYSKITNMNCGYAMITVDGLGQNSIIVIPGANEKFDNTLFNDIEINSKDIVISQFEIPESSIIEFFTKAKDNGATTILNLAPSIDYSKELHQLIDYLIVNELELGFYTKSKVLLNDTTEIINKCKSLLTPDNKGIIVTLGENGSVLVQHDKIYYSKAYLVKAIDTAGAGDCFVGSFATAISNGDNLQEALDFANAASAFCVMQNGTSSSLPSLDDVNYIKVNYNKIP